MMLFQVGFSVVLVLTRMIYYAYYVLTPPMTGYNKLVGSFLMSFTTLVYYANYTKSFYIYTLSSNLFRSIFLNRVKFFIEKTIGENIPMRWRSRRVDDMKTITMNASQNTAENEQKI